MKGFRRVLGTCLSCLTAVSVSLSCFYGGNAVYVSIQARQAQRQEQELGRIYRESSGGSTVQGIDPRAGAAPRHQQGPGGMAGTGGRKGLCRPGGPAG